MTAALKPLHSSPAPGHSQGTRAAGVSPRVDHTSLCGSKAAPSLSHLASVHEIAKRGRHLSTSQARPFCGVVDAVRPLPQAFGEAAKLQGSEHCVGPWMGMRAFLEELGLTPPARGGGQFGGIDDSRHKIEGTPRTSVENAQQLRQLGVGSAAICSRLGGNLPARLPR